MANLVAITYHDEHQAEQVFNTLKRLVTEHVLEMDDAVYVTKDSGGELSMHQLISMPKAGAVTGGASGVLWGTLIGLLFLQPLTGAVIGGAIGAGTGAVAGKFSDYGIDDNFVKELGAQMTPNSSAIFVLVRRATVDKVVPEISRYGGTVLRTSLPDDVEQRLQMALNQGAQATTPPGATTDATTPTV